MTQGTVRATIQTFLKAKNIANLNTLNVAPVLNLPASAWCPNGASYGAAGFVWLMHIEEQNVSAGGAPSIVPNGWRRVDYHAFVIFDWRVLKESTTDDSWITPLDQMCTDISVALRSDPTLGKSVFTSANTFPLETPAITTVIQEPKQIEGTQSIQVHASIDFPVVELVPPGGP
jgi:hypothetical protein